MTTHELERCRELRRQIFEVGYAGGMAHLASCFSCVEILYTLYRKGILHVDPKNPKLAGRDRLVLSKGHAGLALYAVLCEAGLLSEEEFRSYLTPGCHIGGEPCMRDLACVEASTGSLGHGLSMGVGMALAQKLDRLPAKTYVILGDGECQEGTVWEAAISAAALGLDNLVAILDCNQIQKMDSVERTIGYVHWEEKWRAFGWNVCEVDGHDTDALQACLTESGVPGKPRFVIAHTVKGKGVSIMENNPIWHFKLPNRKELKVFQQELYDTGRETENGAVHAESIYQ